MNIYHPPAPNVLPSFLRGLLTFYKARLLIFTDIDFYLIHLITIY